MKKVYLRIAMVLLGLAALGASANAQIVDQVIVTVPFEFTVAGTTVPAGTYHVNRVSNDPREGLVLSCHENHFTAVVIPTDVESAPERQPQLSFETAGNAHFLSRIQTANKVFDIPVSKTKYTEALSHSSMSATGSGNN